MNVCTISSVVVDSIGWEHFCFLFWISIGCSMCHSTELHNNICHHCYPFICSRTDVSMLFLVVFRESIMISECRNCVFKLLPSVPHVQWVNCMFIFIWSVCLCVCVLFQILLLEAFYSHHKWTHLFNGGWRLNSLSDFFKCFVAEVEYVSCYSTRLAIFFTLWKVYICNTGMWFDRGSVLSPYWQTLHGGVFVGVLVPSLGDPSWDVRREYVPSLVDALWGVGRECLFSHWRDVGRSVCSLTGCVIKANLLWDVGRSVCSLTGCVT